MCTRLISPLQKFRGKGLLGKDVVAELRAELAAQGLPNAVVPAVMNDTVATLVGGLRTWGSSSAAGMLMR